MTKATFTWASAASGNWTTTSDWNDSVGTNYPGNPGHSFTDVVFISATGSNYTISLNQGETVSALTLNSVNATLAIGASDTLNVSSNIVLTSGTIDILNSAAIVQTPTISLTSNGVFDLGGGGTLAVGGGNLVISSGTVEATGGTATLTNESGLSATVTTGGVLLANGGVLDITNTTGGSITVGNATTLQVDSTAGSAIVLASGVPALTSNTIVFQGATNDIATSSSITAGTVSGLNVSTIAGNSSASTVAASTNYIDFTGQSITVNAGSANHSGSANTTITLSGGNTLTLTGLTGGDSGAWYVDAVSDGAGGTDIFLSTQVCYAAGTRILTATGEREVELLRAGDIVLTLADGTFDARPIKWIGRRHLDLTSHPRPSTAAPIQIHRGAFAEQMPHRDLLVSPDHAILIDGALICARQLVNGTTIRQRIDLASVDYFHVELESHAILFAEGLPAESYLDTGNRGFFTNSCAPLVLHPELTDERDYPLREAGSCMPFMSDEADVKPVWQRLASRAAALGQPVLQPEVTTDPDLFLLAKGRVVRPLYGEKGLYVFALPKGATEVRLRSRAAAPTETQPWLEDRRQLGMYVARIVLRGASELQEIPVDHPGLAQGWWDVEQDGATLRRWTNGDAALALPASEHQIMLEIHATGVGTGYPTQVKDARRAA